MTDTKKVLIVEDNEKNLKLMRDLLQFNGYEIIETDNAETGIQLAASEQPGLILMDIQLPGMDGIQALAELRAADQTRHIPVIAVTASVMTHDRNQLMDAGFDDYQLKPLEIREFVERVGKHFKA